jgi:UPF0755 protein
MPRSPRIPKGRRNRKGWIWGVVIFAAIILFGLFKVFGSNTSVRPEGDYLYLRTGTSYAGALQALRQGGFVKDHLSFDLLARLAGYPAQVHAGRYHITRGMSNYELIRLLRSGRQTPVRLVITKLRTKDDFARFVGRQLEADSAAIRSLLADTGYLSAFGLDTNTALCAIMPDTYEFFWNTDADKVFRKIARNYERFWTEERRAAARAKGLSPEEAVILASIVEEETNHEPEKPLIASVYLNRLKKGMKLQADPTARFAGGDFTIRRITALQTGIVSPYNTYYAMGLPPGPICTPAATTILAVLAAPETRYLYFCARGDGSGAHLFATTYQEHLRNARAYHQMLNRSGVR